MRPKAQNPPPITERHVQAIWFDAALRPSVLRTVRGVELHIVDPGEWNTGAGPDFRRAVLEFGRERGRVRGDVEVHLRPSDWTCHGHGADAAYRDVALHVTWYGGPVPPALPSGCASLCLGDFLRTRTDFSPDEIDVTAYPYARLPTTGCPCEELLAHDPERITAVLRAAGRRRLAAKARRFVTRILRTGDPGQVFYEEMFAAFGYRGNSLPFRELAEAIPLRRLPADTTVAREALACAAALVVVPRHPWCRIGTRPCNSPEHRMEDAAAVFTGGKPKYTGSQRFAAMFANVIVPFAMARGAIEGPPDWLPPEDVSAPVRLTAYRLMGRDHNPALYAGNGLMIQGLIGVHREFCLAVHPDCTECELCRLLKAERTENEGRNP